MKQYWRELILNYKVFFCAASGDTGIDVLGCFLANALACYTDHVIFPFKNKTMKQTIIRAVIAVAFIALILTLNYLGKK